MLIHSGADDPFFQPLAPVGDSLLLSALVACLPLLTIFVLLGGFRVKAHLAAIAALGVSVATAVVAYRMPLSQSLAAASEGAVFGLFPILWILVNAIWIYTLTVKSGHFDVLRRSMARISDDPRLQAIIIAFCFGGLLEALAGFGAPVAITAVMLIALGHKPLRAASVVLVANTAPVAFGAMAVPIATAGRVAAADPTQAGALADQVAAIVGRQTPVLALFVPLLLVFLVDGLRGVRETWAPALACGISFAVAQFVAANYLAWELTDIVASLVGVAALVLFTRAWKPAPSRAVAEYRAVTLAGVGGSTGPGAGGSTGPGAGGSTGPGAGRVRDPELDHRHEVWRAYAPYAIIIAIFSLAKIPTVDRLINHLAVDPTTGTPTLSTFFVRKTDGWPGLHIVKAGCDYANDGAACLVNNDYTFNWLASAGTLLLLAGVVTMGILGVRTRTALRAYGEVLHKLRFTIITVACVLALAYVMNKAAMTGTIGLWMAGAGGLFAFLSPILGWLGVAVTGSDTSSNALFGKLQATAGAKAGIDPALLVAGNSSGGVVAKMISPQSLAVATAATDTSGQEGDLFRKVIGYSIVLILFMAVLVYLQSTPLLAWMLP